MLNTAYNKLFWIILSRKMITVMTAPLIPANEEFRLQNLYYYEILDTAPENDFDDLAELVSVICNCPMAIISFIDKDRQWIKARKNITVKQDIRRESFCRHVINGNDVLVVNDAHSDSRFFDNPYATGGLNIGFYAGAPITSPEGYNLGTVCAMDNSPGQLSPGQSRSLEAIARQVSRLLELRVKSKQAHEAADLFLESEKKYAQLNIAQRDEENYKTALVLHEEIAQMNAAVGIYINLAKTNQANNEHFLNNALKELDGATKIIKTLSRSITPTTLDSDNYAGHIQDLIAAFNLNKPRPASYSFIGQPDKLNSWFGLMIYRIIQDLLTLVEPAEDIQVQIEIGTGLAIRINYSGPGILDETEKAMLKSNISHRVEMLQGRMDYPDENVRNEKMYYLINTPLKA